MDEPINILKEQMATLPKELRKYIADGARADTLMAIGKGVGLTEDQQAALRFEAMMVLTGLGNIKDLAPSIQANVGVTEEVSKRLATGIEGSILEPVRQFLIPLQINDDQKIPEQQLAPKIDNATDKTPSQNTLSSTPSPNQAVQAESQKVNAGLAFLDQKLGGSADPLLPMVENQPVQAGNPAQPQSVPAPNTQTSDNTAAQTSEQATPSPQPEPKKYPGNSDPYREPID